MKTLPKLWKSLSIAILLIGINSTASFAETLGLPNRPSTALFPTRHKCLDLLELEKVVVKQNNSGVWAPELGLAADYYSVAGWLQGFFTAWNLNPASDGNVTKEAAGNQMMAWIFSYCRAHPSEDLVKAALEFMNAVGGATFKR